MKDLVGSVASRRWAWAASLAVCHVGRVAGLGDVVDLRVAAVASSADGDPHRVYLSCLLHPHLRPRHPHRRRLPCRRSPVGPCVRARRHTMPESVLVQQCARIYATLTYWNLAIVSFMSPDEYSYSFLLWPKMMTATSTEHSTESSCAFLNKPPLRLRKVTDLMRGAACQYARVTWWKSKVYLLRSSLMGLISILRRPMARARV